MGTRQAFEEGLDGVNKEILRMGVMVEEALRRAVESLVNKDGELARAVVAGDAAINQMEQEIEDRCIVLIAREQPVATDLRRLVTLLKVVTQLERMGDHALHVAKGTLRLLPETYMKPLIDIPRMAELAIGMIRDVLTRPAQPGRGAGPGGGAARPPGGRPARPGHARGVHVHDGELQIHLAVHLAAFHQPVHRTCRGPRDQHLRVGGVQRHRRACRVEPVG